jgi:TolB protein
MKKIITFTTLFFTLFALKAQNQVGIFESNLDIGPVLLKGSAKFDAKSQTYTLTGSGENIWFKKDELHFAYKKLNGDFIVTTQPSFMGTGIDPHRKNGWMARASTDTSSAMICLTVHGDGLTAFQYRKQKGGNVEEIKIPITHAEILQIERRGRSYHIAVSKIGQAIWTVEIPDFDFPQELLVGLFICSHNKNVSEKSIFSQTRIFTLNK